MPGLYLGLLLVSLAGLAHIDNRQRLVFYKKGTPRFRFEWPQLIVTVTGVLFFSIWDALGIANHIFFKGQGNLLVGIQVFNEYPIEEVLFLTLFVYCSQLSLAAWLSFSKRAQQEDTK